jgi:diacylglycerol kinase family enzyme
MLARMSAQLSPSAPQGPTATAAQPVRSYFVVLNPGSGEHASGEVRAQIAQVLEQAGCEVDFTELRPGSVPAACDQAARRAAEAGGALVAVGGDGTLNAAAQAALAHGCIMGVIAQGTFNFFARDHALSQDAQEGARALLSAQPRPVQVGLLNGRVFLVNGSIGLYPQLLEDRETFKRKWGRHRWVAMLAGLMTLLGWRRQLDIEVELDGRIRQVRTPTLFVGNNALQLEKAGVPPELVRQVREGGRLVGIVARPHGPGFKLRLMVNGLLQRLGASAEVDTFAFRSLTVATGRVRRLKAATDGEAVTMQPPLRFAVSPKPLMLLSPASP